MIFINIKLYYNFANIVYVLDFLSAAHIETRIMTVRNSVADLQSSTMGCKSAQTTNITKEFFKITQKGKLNLI